MTTENLAFVSFEPRDSKFVAFMSMQQVIFIERDSELVLREAAEVYGRLIRKMRSLVTEIRTHRVNHTLLPARTIWELGDIIFELKEELDRQSLQIDGLYEHLIRDLGVKRKWLEKVVIFRRYLPSKDLVPKSLNWGQFEKGTRHKAERLRRGILPS
jgi:hypothetical protein